MDRNTCLRRTRCKREISRPSRGGVDRNDIKAEDCPASRVKSPLAWGRGSKPRWNRLHQMKLQEYRSPLAWGRGSKHYHSREIVLANIGPVAPRVGAWIETFFGTLTRVPTTVSPLAWGRGSKPYPSTALYRRVHMSPLAWGRGSKPLPMARLVAYSRSPLAWGRGSKRLKQAMIPPYEVRMSPLAWGRGSKHLLLR